MSGTTEITCNMLRDAIDEICPDTGENIKLTDIKKVELDGNHFIALQADKFDKLNELAKMIVGDTTKVTKVSTLDIMSKQMKMDSQEIKLLLEKFMLEDILSDQGIVGKADQTIQIACCSNYERFKNVLTNKFETYLKFVEDDKIIIKNFFEIIRYISDSECSNFNNTIIERSPSEEPQEVKKPTILDLLKFNLTRKKITEQQQGQYIAYLKNGIKQNSILHEDLKKENYYYCTTIVEAQLNLCLTFLQRILLFIYRDFEINNKKADPPKFQVKDVTNNVDNQKILNEKLDAIFGMELTDYIDYTIDIIVDDKYAPNTEGMGDRFSSWRISKNTTVFDLISIIKSMSVYLRLQL